MKAPIILVTTALTLAIVLAASLLIATGTRGDGAFRPLTANPGKQIAPVSPTR
jgi:hypothetical protein